MATLVHLTLASGNKKTGPMPVSTSAENTCPPSCPLSTKGCYAKAGPLLMHWQRLNRGETGITWTEFCKKIAAFPRHTLWRHNQAGDLPGHRQDIDATEMNQLVNANHGKRGFTYTHKHTRDNGELHTENIAQIREANQKGFTVNLSANSLAHADKLADLNAGPVVTLLPKNCTINVLTPAGRKVVVCPATYRENVSCWSCGLCQKQRGAIVGFPVHGTAAKTANTIASV